MDVGLHKATGGQPHDGRQHGEQHVNVTTGEVFQMLQPRPTEYENYRRRESLVLGVLLIVAGSLCIVFNAVAIGFLTLSSLIAYGLWGGVLFIICGSFGVSSRKSSTTCKVTAFMVLCIISACAAAVAVILSSLAAAGNSSLAMYCKSNYRESYYSYYYDICQSHYNLGTAMNVLIACLSFIAGVAAIRGSVICCKVACCGKESNRNQQMVAVPIQHQQYPGQIIVAYPQGYPAHPMMNIDAPPYQANPSAPTIKY